MGWGQEVKVRFWGTRGSIPTPGPLTVRHGGNTLCVEVRTADGALLILDAGSGIFPLGLHLDRTESRPLQAHLLLTHTHWDHIQGLPFFTPAHVPGNQLCVWAPRDPRRTIRELLEAQASCNNIPYHLETMAGQLLFRELAEEEFCIGKTRIRTQFLNHTVLCLGYRIEADGQVLVHCTDVEPHLGGLLRKDRKDSGLASRDRSAMREGIMHREDARLVSFARGADLYIQDSMYTPEEYSSRRGWGHSPCDFAIDVALAAEVRRFVLFHHDPDHEDAFLDAMVETCRERAARYQDPPQVLGAWEGLEIDLQGPLPGEPGAP